MALSKLDSISDLVSKAVRNSHITSEEFQLILDEMKKYEQMKQVIRSKSQKAAQTSEISQKNKTRANG